MYDCADFIKIYKENIKRDGADELLQMLKSSDFFSAPASTRYHDSFEGGLCHHSVSVFNYLKDECEGDGNFPNVSMETIAIVSLLHDLCKVGFYKVSSRNTKDENGKWIQVPYYEVDDLFPFGHGEKSVYMINDIMKLTDEEAMAINAHMGGFDERKNVISNIFKMCQLAVYLHVADLKATYVK